jgi:hypothetical protein
MVKINLCLGREWPISRSVSLCFNLPCLALLCFALLCAPGLVDGVVILHSLSELENSGHAIAAVFVRDRELITREPHAVANRCRESKQKEEYN